MSYIMDLRKLVGHKPLMMCACGCLIFNQEGKVLLQKRDDDNLWGNPGGSMELGETIYETIEREVYEETGLKVEDLKIFEIYSGEDSHHIYPNGDEIYSVNIMFKTSKYKGELKPVDGESLDLKFFDIKDIPKNVTKPFICVAKDLKEKCI